MADDHNCYHEWSLTARYSVSGSLSLEESCTSTYAYLESLGIPSLLEGSHSWNFFVVSFVVDMSDVMHLLDC